VARAEDATDFTALAGAAMIGAAARFLKFVAACGGSRTPDVATPRPRHRPCRMRDSLVHWNCGSVHKIAHEIRHATSQVLRGELMEARVTAQSQGLKLRERMEEANIQHSQEVRVDLPRIAVTAMAGGTAGEVFFCKLGAIRVREVLNPGNDRPLPTTVRLEGLTVPHSGGYNLLNALVYSNGDIRLVVDAQTQVVPAVWEVEAPVVRRYPPGVLTDVTAALN